MDYYKSPFKEEKRILYHGSLNQFSSFKPTKDYAIFLSDDPSFAYDYADAKSFGQGIDKPPIVYKVKANVNFFDPTNRRDLQKLEKSLPDLIPVRISNFGIFSKLTPKKIIIDAIQGYETIVGGDQPIRRKSKNTWMFFENDVVMSEIKRAGFDGYIAKEKGSTIYAVFNVKNLQIIGTMYQNMRNEFKLNERYKGQPTTFTN